jgi:signal peptide peptidase SppA
MDDGTSTVQTRADIRAAVNDDRVRGILLHVDSPGGTVAGTDDLADDISAANKRKPVHAYIEDLGASAAYYLASQAGRVSINKSGEVGSIGVYGVVFDMTERAERLGITVHVIKAGQYKAAGYPGTPITDEQLAEWQTLVDADYDMFVRAVARGRQVGVKVVREWADGRTFKSKTAVDMGLVDSVQTVDAAIAELRAEVDRQTGRRQAAELESLKMDDNKQSAAGDVVAAEVTNAEPATASPAADQATSRPATFAEIKAACSGAPADFVVAQLDAAATVDQARNAYIAHLQSERDQAANRAREAADQAATSRPGVDPVGVSGKIDDDNPAVDGEPVAAFRSAVRERVAAGMSQRDAVSSVVREQPDLHVAYVNAHNQANGRTAEYQG